jgi:hypothetical protein
LGGGGDFPVFLLGVFSFFEVLPNFFKEFPELVLPLPFRAHGPVYVSPFRVDVFDGVWVGVQKGLSKGFPRELFSKELLHDLETVFVELWVFL